MSCATRYMMPGFHEKDKKEHQKADVHHSDVTSALAIAQGSTPLLGSQATLQGVAWNVIGDKISAC